MIPIQENSESGYFFVHLCCPAPFMQLTSYTDFALRLLIYLANNPARPVSTREVADAYGISLNHLTKVAKSLTKGGWLISSRGGNGGLSLAPHTMETHLGEIVRYTEVTRDIAECFNTATNTCPITNACRLKPILYRARKAFFDVLDGATVRDLSQNPGELNAAFTSSRPTRRRK
jgi:Rrf2 family nitric oxide-sensitive transcriptional repressor